MIDKIEVYRRKVNTIDKSIVELLIQRVDTVRKIGTFKRQLNIPVEDAGREKEILERLYQMAGDSLRPDQIDLIFNTIFKTAKELQHSK